MYYIIQIVFLANEWLRFNNLLLVNGSIILQHRLNILCRITWSLKCHIQDSYLLYYYYLLLYFIIINNLKLYKLLAHS